MALTTNRRRISLRAGSSSSLIGRLLLVDGCSFLQLIGSPLPRTQGISLVFRRFLGLLIKVFREVLGNFSRCGGESCFEVKSTAPSSKLIFWECYHGRVCQSLLALHFGLKIVTHIGVTHSLSLKLKRSFVERALKGLNFIAIII